MQRLIDVLKLMGVKELEPIDHFEYWANFPDALLLEKFFINDNGKLKAVPFDAMLYKFEILKDGTVTVVSKHKKN